MKRIGDILIANGWIEPSILPRALVKQKDSGHRLCSLLVIGGVLGADDAACALAEQHGVAAALQRHLKGRDHAVASLLPSALARAVVALPLGRMGSGEIIVCVRDPSPELETQLARAMKERIRLAVAPAHQLEALVLEAYGAQDDPNEFDIDLGTGPVMSLELDDDDPGEPLGDEALTDLGALELVDLDHTGVSKDESQSQLSIGKRAPTPLPIASDAPVVDAPSYRSSIGIVVDAPSQREPPGRAALSAAGIVIPRTQTPEREVPAVVARTQTPARPTLAAAAKSAMQSVADAESAAVAQSLAAAAAAMAELSFDDEPPPITAPPIENELPTPEPAKAAPAKAASPITPLRPPPAALAALQRASSAATRVPNVPLRPIPSALPPRPIPSPKAVPPAPEIAVGTQLPSATLAVSPRLSEALTALTAASKIDAVCDAVMAFAAKRWSAVLLLDVDGVSATGRRGHGAQISDDLAQWVVMSLEEPSLLQAALTSSSVASATPNGHGDVESRLQQLLGRPRAPSAITITVGGKPLLMLAVGDPDGDDLKTAAADLARLGDGTGAALTRLRGR